MHNVGIIQASLNGYTLLITGGGSGIGYSTAKLFAKMGANVAVNYLSEDIESKKRINKLKDEYTNVIEVTGDVSQEKIAKKIIKDKEILTFFIIFYKKDRLELNF